MLWNSLTTLDREELIGWAANQPWAAAMKECGQDVDWHAEGDVWTHSIQVCRELSRLNDWESFRKNEQQLLMLAALFHDCAKPMTTVIDSTDGRIRSPRHAAKGEVLTRNILKELGCPFRVREQICGLVRYHGKPVHLVRDSRPDIELARLSWLSRHDWLHAIALADLRGRISRETNRSQDDLDWYRWLAEEQDCWNGPFKLPNSHARFLLGRRKLTDLQYTPFEDFRCSVTLLSGLPGSGKDTWLRQHRPELPVVSLDEWRSRMGVTPEDKQGRVVQAAREQCREILRQKRAFALNGTNTSRQLRSLWIELFAQYQARVEIVYLESTLEETLQQNRERTMPVPDSVIRRLAGRCQPPTMLEAHEVHYVISDRLKTASEIADK